MSDFKVGDRVRTRGASLYSDGDMHTVLEVKPRGARHGGLPAQFASYVITDKADSGIWTQYLELVDPVPAATGLDRAAAQLGLTAEQAPQALEIGAYALAHGIDPEDIRSFHATIIRFNGRKA